mmetsp:Transcript_32588/g.28846  ORF Transcript_32588/g.28846 Transcript_32588/m.28846 type:complete len:189 (-) Transcript_32588:17-583(-)
MGLLSRSMYQWYNKNGVKEPGTLIMSCPVSMKPMPKSVKELNLNNYTSSVLLQFPVMEDMKESIPLCKSRFSKLYTLPYLMSALNFMMLFRFIPGKIAKLMLDIAFMRIDFLMTNVCGPKEPIYLCNKEILNITPFLNNFKSVDLVIACFSYKGSLSFQIVADKDIQMDPHDFLKLLENNLDTMINKS